MDLFKREAELAPNQLFNETARLLTLFSLWVI